MGNQKAYIEKGQTIQLPKGKRTDNTLPKGKRTDNTITKGKKDRQYNYQREKGQTIQLSKGKRTDNTITKGKKDTKISNDPHDRKY
jgi:stress response protein SCP2